MIIQSIHTGIALGGRRRAILVIAPEQKPGSLAGLRDFLQSHGLRADPGYDEGHLLRVRGFGEDGELRTLLQDYAREVKPKGTEPLFDPKMPFVPMDRGDRQPRPFGTVMRQNSTGLVGVTSLVSGIAFLTKDMLAWRSAPLGSMERAKTGISAMAATLFVTASAGLTVLGFRAANKPSVAELLQGMESRGKQGDNAAAEEPSSAQHSIHFAMNNPWLVATVFNALGTTIKTTGHAIPMQRTVRNPFTLQTKEVFQADRMELAGSASAFASLGFLGTATPKQPTSLLGIPTYEKSDQNDPMKRRYGKRFWPLDPANDHGSQGHINMKIGGSLAMASNLVFGTKGVLDVYAGSRKPDEIGKKALKSWPLLLVLPFNIAADYLTTISKPRFVYSTDELASETAAYIAKKLDNQTAGAEQVHQEIFALSEMLSKHPRVSGNSHQLREAIAGRLHADYGYEMLSNFEGVQEYQHLWEVSPFIKPALKMGNPAHETETEAQSETVFVKKLETQRQTDEAFPILR